MDAALKEAVARKLYEQWCDDFGHRNPDVPDWSRFESGADLNPCAGFNANNFREDAEALAPFDSSEIVARRMCFNNGIPECHGSKGPPCSVETCEGWREWLHYAEEITALVRDCSTVQ